MTKHYSIPEIEKLLSEAMPAPWHTSHIEEPVQGWPILRVATDEYVVCTSVDVRSVDRPNFNLIAAAPEIIWQLLERIKELEK